MAFMYGFEVIVDTLVGLRNCSKQEQRARGARYRKPSHLSQHAFDFWFQRKDWGESHRDVVKSVLVRNVSAHRAGIVFGKERNGGRPTAAPASC